MEAATPTTRLLRHECHQWRRPAARGRGFSCGARPGLVGYLPGGCIVCVAARLVTWYPIDRQTTNRPIHYILLSFPRTHTLLVHSFAAGAVSEQATRDLNERKTPGQGPLNIRTQTHTHIYIHNLKILLLIYPKSLIQYILHSAQNIFILKYYLIWLLNISYLLIFIDSLITLYLSSMDILLLLLL